MTEYFNRTEEKEKRRRLRNDMPKAEVILWSRLDGVLEMIGREVNERRAARTPPAPPFVRGGDCCAPTE